MKKINFIHIGYQKTATTWLQKNAYYHPDIKMFNVGEHSKLLWNFIYDSEFFFDSNKYKKIFQSIINTESRNCCYGLSWERLSGDFLTGYDAKRIADRLYQVFGKIKIIITIRTQLSMMTSTYSQYIKMGGTCSLKKFLSDVDVAGYRLLERLKYIGLINYYKKLFGAKNVYIDCYENIRTNQKKYLLRLYNFLNIDVSKISSCLLLSNKVNKRLSTFSLSLKKMINQFFYLKYNKTPILSLPYSLHQFIRYKIIEERIDKILFFLPSNRKNAFFGLTQRHKKKLNEYFIESNNELAKEINIDLESLGYAL